MTYGQRPDGRRPSGLLSDGRAKALEGLPPPPEIPAGIPGDVAAVLLSAAELCDTMRAEPGYIPSGCLRMASELRRRILELCSAGA